MLFTVGRRFKLPGKRQNGWEWDRAQPLHITKRLCKPDNKSPKVQVKKRIKKTEWKKKRSGKNTTATSSLCNTHLHSILSAASYLGDIAISWEHIYEGTGLSQVHIDKMEGEWSVLVKINEMFRMKHKKMRKNA